MGKKIAIFAFMGAMCLSRTDECDSLKERGHDVKMNHRSSATGTYLIL